MYLRMAAPGRGAGGGDVTTAIGEQTWSECASVLRPRSGVPCVFWLAIGRWRSS